MFNTMARGFLAVALVAVVGVNVWGQEYSLTDLGPGQAFGINSSGQVVGVSWVTGQAFLYSGGSMQNIGALTGSNQTMAYGINDRGQIVLDALIGSGGSQHVLIYSGGSMQDVGTFNGNLSLGCGINNNGEVAGASIVNIVYNGYQSINRSFRTSAFYYLRISWRAEG